MCSSMRRHTVKVFAPASVSNVAVAFDHLGFAIDAPGDEVIVREGSSAGLHITKITGDGRLLPRSVAHNTAGVAAVALMEHLGVSDMPIEMEIRKKMQFGTGMGSSAASAAAAVYAVERYVRAGLTKRDILKFAIMGEQVSDGVWHADNVAPSLLGGMVLIRDNTTLDLIKLYVPKGLRAVVIYPHLQILTRDSRAILSSSVGFDLAVQQAANAAGFVAGMFNSDLGLIKRSLDDLLVEPQRAHMIPLFYEVKALAISEGALGFSISGAGPSMFALCDNTRTCDSIREQVYKLYGDKKIVVDVYDSPINQEGAIVC